MDDEDAVFAEGTWFSPEVRWRATALLDISNGSSKAGGRVHHGNTTVYVYGAVFNLESAFRSARRTSRSLCRAFPMHTDQ